MIMETEKEKSDSIRCSARAGLSVEPFAVGGMVRQLPDQSPILGTTITLERLRKRGYEAMLSYYGKVALYPNEPPYTRPVRTVA